MEKLQLALEKARAAREGAAKADGTAKSDAAPAPAAPPERKAAEAATRAPARARATSTRRDTPPDAVWADLTPFSPDPKALVRNRIVALEAGAAATPFDILRTKIVLQMRRNGWRRLAITSPLPACGKTTTALNLATGLSRQPDLTAMLLEIDLRRPNMAAMLGHRPEHDITAMLSGEVPFADQAVRLRGNVAVSMARRHSNDPSRYMLSHDTITTLDTLERDYAPDLMIFDLPPLLISDDTRAFLGNVDCALMVARAGKSSIAQIDTCEREIAEHTNMLGVVLNQVKHADESAGYDYDYKS